MTDKNLKEANATVLPSSKLRLPGFLKRRDVVGKKTEDSVVETVGRENIVLPHRQRRTRPSMYLISLIGCVVIPAFLSTIYLIFLASDQYLAEAHFAVRKSQFMYGSDRSSGGSAGASLGLGATSSGGTEQEPHIVANYLRSRAAIEDIRKELNVEMIFQRPEADFWARLKKNPSSEELVDYWNKQISTYVDGPSGVVSVSARAFRPDDAKALVEAFLRASERLANRLSERARIDAMQKSEIEVRRAEANVREALADLRQYRDQEGLISPLMEATSTARLLSEAMSEKIKLQGDYYVAVRALAPDAPSVQGLKTRLDGLDVTIESLKSQLTSRSSEGRTVSAAIVRFEELELKRVFAEKMYTLAQDALERARLRAEQQAIYIAVFVPPHLPQEARFPERYSMSLLLAVGFLLLWGVGALTVAAVEDHTL